MAPARLLSRFSWPERTSFTFLSATASFYGAPVPEWLAQQARGAGVEEPVRRWTREHEEEMRSRIARLREVVGNLQGPLSKARPVVVEGDATERILTTIAAEKIDLVVVGSHTQRPLASSLLGSTAEAVLNHATCSVLVMPHQASS